MNIGGHQSSSEKSVLTLLRVGELLLGHPSRNAVTILTELPRLQLPYLIELIQTRSLCRYSRLQKCSYEMLQCLTQKSRLRMEAVEREGEEQSKTEAQEKSIATSYVLVDFFLLFHIRYIFFPPFCLASYSSHTLLFYSFLTVTSVPYLVPFTSIQFNSFHF